VDETNKLLAFRRWMDGGPGDETVIVANFSAKPLENLTLGFFTPGAWKLRLNSDWKGYSAAFGNYPSSDVTAEAGECDGLPNHGHISIGPYSVLVFSQVQG
jgi:1,4-alpha-glucan branching enzyme